MNKHCKICRLATMILTTACIWATGNDVYFVTIAPLREALTAIAPSNAEIRILVPPGASPENFTLDIRALQSLEKCSCFFTIGAPCETTLVPRLKAAFPHIQFIDGTIGMTFRNMAEEHHHHGENRDPHVWLSPENLAIFTKNAATALCLNKPQSAAEIQENADNYCKRLLQLTQYAKQAFAPLRGQKLLVLHPAFGYLLDFGDIKQLAIEHDGKMPTGRQLSQLIEEAKRHGMRVIFAQPQFNQNTLNAIAKELNATIDVLDPLPEKYIEGMTRLIDTIVQTTQNQR